MLLFVYGTLRRGEPSHSLLAGARFVGTAQTEPRYELVDLGEYPALVEGGDTAVVGELYDVNHEMLVQLDIYEDVPTLYERKSLRFAQQQAAGYLMRREHAEGLPRIASGDWRRR